jgi:hypothetical protein
MPAGFFFLNFAANKKVKYAAHEKNEIEFGAYLLIVYEFASADYGRVDRYERSQNGRISPFGTTAQGFGRKGGWLKN